MMQLNVLSFTLSELCAFPKNEAILMIQLGHLCNELTALYHWQMVLARTKTQTEPEIAGNVMQMLFVTRLLAGKLNEAWEMLQTDFFGSKLSKLLVPLLDAEAVENLERVKAYFSGKNALTRIRNQFAFHYGSDEIREQLSSPNDDLVLRLYAHKQRANCLSQFAEQVVSMTIFTDHTAFEKAVNDCDTLYNNFLEFAQRCIVLILQRHVNDKVTGSWPIVEIEDPPFIDELRLPFYLRTRQVDSS